MAASNNQFRKRSAILASLRQTKQHPSAEELYQALQQQHQDISRATIYRNLAFFRDQGLIQSLGTVNGIERFDGDITPHDHFVCSKCSCVQDLPRMQMPEDFLGGAAEKLSCRIDGYRLMFAGICQHCLSENQKSIH